MKLKHFLYLPLLASLLLTASSCAKSCKSKTVQESTTAVIDDELKKLDKDQFSTEMKKRGTVIIDIRQPQEFEQGHIEGAVNLNFFDPQFKFNLLELDRDKSYCIYDKGEAKAFRAMKFMEDNGFKKVLMLKGGYKEWSTVHAGDENADK